LGKTAFEELPRVASGGGNIGYLAALETDATKCGFGPGEEGMGCISRMMEENKACKEEVVIALKQGCAMIGTSECVSPPQVVDSKILYAGPRIHLAFAENGKSLTALSLLCGGD
jgi:hypothetical protein